MGWLAGALFSVRHPVPRMGNGAVFQLLPPALPQPSRRDDRLVGFAGGLGASSSAMCVTSTGMAAVHAGFCSSAASLCSASPDSAYVIDPLAHHLGRRLGRTDLQGRGGRLVRLARPASLPAS